MTRMTQSPKQFYSQAPDERNWRCLYPRFRNYVTIAGYSYVDYYPNPAYWASDRISPNIGRYLFAHFSWYSNETSDAMAAEFENDSGVLWIGSASWNQTRHQRINIFSDQFRIRLLNEGADSKYVKLHGSIVYIEKDDMSGPLHDDPSWPTPGHYTPPPKDVLEID